MSGGGPVAFGGIDTMFKNFTGQYVGDVQMGDKNFSPTPVDMSGANMAAMMAQKSGGHNR